MYQTKKKKKKEWDRDLQPLGWVEKAERQRAKSADREGGGTTSSKGVKTKFFGQTNYSKKTEKIVVLGGSDRQQSRGLKWKGASARGAPVKGSCEGRRYHARNATPLPCQQTKAHHRFKGATPMGPSKKEDGEKKVESWGGCQKHASSSVQVRRIGEVKWTQAPVINLTIK